jgi:hypothetical protein
MTTQQKAGFLGVTQLRTTWHGELSEAQQQKQISEFRREAVDFFFDENPIDFEAVLEEYSIQDETEIDFLMRIASQPGARQIFLETVLQTKMHRTGSAPISIAMLQQAYSDVIRDTQQNSLQGANGTPSTPRKGWVRFNVFKRVSKGFEGGMGSIEGSIRHDR